jgi:Crp-like helix-turn-helix domain
VPTGVPAPSLIRDDLNDEIGQIIGMSRETVKGTLADFRKHHIADLHGSTLLIQNMSALQRLAAA